MFAKLKQLFDWSKQKHKLKPTLDQVFDEDQELDWMNPPLNPLDVAAWDRYWIDHLKHGIGPPFFDMFCNDQALVAVMKANHMKTVLCAGNGISQEPHTLAQAGFQVVALDISPQAIQIAKSFQFPKEAFAHYCDPSMRSEGGQVEFVVGDMLDSTICPGPFDVIIERRTMQLFFSQNMDVFLNALIARLGSNGIFISQCHNATWKPPEEPLHYTRPWFEKNGWTIWNGSSVRKPEGRVAWLEMSTG